MTFYQQIRKYYKDQIPKKLKDLDKKSPFEDVEFPDGGDIIGWRRLSEIKKENKKYDLFDQYTDCCSFKQGNINDCYIINVMSSLSNFSELITQLIYPDYLNDEGYYEICLFFDGNWQKVIIDDKIPYENNKFLYASPSNNYYGLFICLFEKAIAKIHGGYSKIDFGVSSKIYKMLTGFNTGQLEKPEIIKNEKLFDDLIDYLKTGYLISMIGNLKENKGKHAYSLLRAFNYNYIESGKKYQRKLLTIRNPWGKNKIKNLNTETKRKRKVFFNNKIINNEFKDFENTDDDGLAIVEYDYLKTLQNLKQFTLCYTMFGSKIHPFYFDPSNLKELKREYGELGFYFKLKITKLINIEIVTSASNELSKQKIPEITIEIHQFLNILSEKKIDYKPLLELDSGEYLVIINYKNDKKPRNLRVLFCSKFKFKIDFIDCEALSEKKKNLREIYKRKINNNNKKYKEKIYRYGHNLMIKKKFYDDLIDIMVKETKCQLPINSKGYYIDLSQTNEVRYFLKIHKYSQKKYIASKNKKNSKNLIYFGYDYKEGKVYGKGKIYKFGYLVFEGNIKGNSIIEGTVKFEENGQNFFQIQTPYHEHPLLYIQFKRTQYLCNHCGKEIKNDSSYYCTLCDFNICDECEKRISDILTKIQEEEKKKKS
jgi:hypothetical protein